MGLEVSLPSAFFPRLPIHRTVAIGGELPIHSGGTVPDLHRLPFFLFRAPEVVKKTHATVSGGCTVCNGSGVGKMPHLSGHAPLLEDACGELRSSAAFS